MEKLCRGCGDIKSLDQFYADNRTKDGRCYRCKPCHEARYGTWKRANRQKVSGYNRKWWAGSDARFARYGITRADYTRMLDEQGGVCAVCGGEETIVIRGRRRPLHIDHDHLRGGVRGLLCSACNTGIGKFGDDPGKLEAAAEYLRASEQRQVLREVGDGDGGSRIEAGGLRT